MKNIKEQLLDIVNQLEDDPTLEDMFNMPPTKEKLTIPEIIDKYKMSGFASYYYNSENFKLKNYKPCFIPRKAKTIDEVYSYKDLEYIVKQWLITEQTQKYLKGKVEENFTVEKWVLDLYYGLGNEHPLEKLLAISSPCSL